jgi:hypothetical protein
LRRARYAARATVRRAPPSPRAVLQQQERPHGGHHCGRLG